MLLPLPLASMQAADVWRPRAPIALLLPQSALVEGLARASPSAWPLLGCGALAREVHLHASRRIQSHALQTPSSLAWRSYLIAVAQALCSSRPTPRPP